MVKVSHVFFAAMSLAAASCAGAETPSARALVFPWVELIGFDNTKPDYGVAEYLGRMPRLPDAVSLHLDNDRTFRAYGGESDGDFMLPENSCSYRGRPYNGERRRQAWRASQLKGLVAELRRHGVDVYASFFYYKVMEMVHDRVELLADQITRFLSDFGFSGFHGADGFSPPVQCLEAPERGLLAGSDDKNRPQIARQEAERFASAWKTIVAKLKSKGLKCFVNTCWALDPYEALYRYGVDYRLLAKTGIDGFVVESSASAKRLFDGPSQGPSPLDRSIAMLMRLKAACPEVPLVILHAVHDGAEQWSSLRHAPCRCRAEAIALGGIFYGNRHALDGFLPCLSDGITGAEWESLYKVWDLALAPARAPFGFRYVWSDRAFDAEFDACASTLDCSSNTFLAEMIGCGAMIDASVSVKEALEDPTMPILVVNPRFFPRDELDALVKRSAPVQLVGIGSGPPGYREYELQPPAKRVFPGNAFSMPLPENMPPHDVVQSAAWQSALRRMLSTETPDLRLTAYWMADGRLAMIARNDGEKYLDAKVDVGVDFADILTHTQFPTAPVQSTLRFRVAPGDAVVLSLGVHEPPLPGAPVE